MSDKILDELVCGRVRQIKFQSPFAAPVFETGVMGEAHRVLSESDGDEEPTTEPA